MTAYTESVPAAKRAADWLDDALCRSKGEDPEDWFPIGGGTEAKAAENHAKAVCWRCLSQPECLRWALETGQENGIWGGLSEGERQQLRRRKAVRRTNTDAFAGTKRPKAKPMTLAESMAAHTEETDGHLLWGGPQAVSHKGRSYSPNQVAFYLDRGVWPTGTVTRSCKVSGCVLGVHLVDEEERTRCGTPGGYRKHLKQKTKPCAPCRRANADADNRLRWTGTTKELV